MEPAGLIDKIIDSVSLIAVGRLGLDTEGEAEAGRISYHDGLTDAMAVFQEAAVSNDARSIILVGHALSMPKLCMIQSVSPFQPPDMPIPQQHLYKFPVPHGPFLKVIKMAETLWMSLTVR